MPAQVDWNDVKSVRVPTSTVLGWNVKYSDTFNRADGALGTMDGGLGGSSIAWDGTTTADPVITDNVATLATTIAYTRGITASSPNQGLRAKVVALPAGVPSFWTLRRTSFVSGTERYAMQISTAGAISVLKGFTTLASQGGTGLSVKNGDTVEFRVRDVGADALLEVLVNGVISWMRTDSSPVTISGVTTISAAAGQSALVLDDVRFLEYGPVQSVVAIQLGPNVLWASSEGYTLYEEQRRNLFPYVFEGSSALTEPVPGWIRGTRDANGTAIRIMGLGMYSNLLEVPWESNTTYRLTFRARRSAGMGSVGLYARPAVNNTTGERAILATVNLSTTATTHSFEFLTPTAALGLESGIAIRAGGSSGVVGDWIEIERDSVMISVVTDTEPAFNGNSTPANPELQKYSWVGAEYASQSVYMVREYEGDYDPDPGEGDGTLIVNKSLTSNVATITTEGPHGFEAGDSVVITGVDSTFNGTYTVTSAPTLKTFTYARTAANVASTSATGTVVISDNPPEDPDDSVGRIFHMNFDALPTGKLDLNTFKAYALASGPGVTSVGASYDPITRHWGPDGMSSIIVDPVAGRSGKRYVAHTPIGGYTNNQPTGATFRMRFNSVPVATCQYRLRFKSGFDWAEGGKIPGLSGGSNPGGGDYTLTGYSARFMWGGPVNGYDGIHALARGGIHVYLYYAEQNQRPGLPKPGGGVYVQGQCYGDGINVPTTLNGSTRLGLEREKDYIITQTVTMNTPGQRNGRLEVWVDEGSGPTKRISKTLMYRQTGYTWQTDNYYNNIFFGGNKDGIHDAETPSDVIIDDIKTWSRRLYT